MTGTSNAGATNVTSTKSNTATKGKATGKKNADNAADIRAYNYFRHSVPQAIQNEANNTGDKKAADSAKVQREVKSSSNSFALKDYNWSEEYSPTSVPEEDYLPIQTMTITEFQPEFSFNWGEAADLAAAVAEKGIKMIPYVGDAAVSAIDVGLKSLAHTLNRHTVTAYKSQPDKVVGLPIEFIQGLFDGSYLNAFEVPFFNDTYLKADTTGNWSAGGMEQVMGSRISDIMKQGANVDFPTTPTWQISEVANRDAITVEFYLINNSDKNLNDNFRFLNSIISGAFWVQLDFVQKSPNVYDIEVPGRFHSYFAAMGVEVSQIGKLRTNEYVVKQNGASVQSINSKTLFPDAYKMTLNIVDLCPNNFNNYVDYFMKGQSSKIRIGATVEKFNTIDALKNIKKNAEDLVKDKIEEFTSGN